VRRLLLAAVSVRVDSVVDAVAGADAVRGRAVAAMEVARRLRAAGLPANPRFQRLILKPRLVRGFGVCGCGEDGGF
jgi:hypothetical protein